MRIGWFKFMAANSELVLGRGFISGFLFCFDFWCDGDHLCVTLDWGGSSALDFKSQFSVSGSVSACWEAKMIEDCPLCVCVPASVGMWCPT